MIRTRVAVQGAAMFTAVALSAWQSGMAAGRTTGPAQHTVLLPAATTCKAKQLRTTLSQASPGATHHGYVIHFKNRGRICTITGYPGVDALNTRGHRILSAKRTSTGYLGGVASGGLPKIHLAKGKTASAIVEWIDLGSPCPRARSLRITAPDAVTSVVFSPKSLRSETLCHLEVHPVVAGITGQTR
jgi:hypothetical protein